MKIGTVYLILLIFLCNCLGRNPEDSLWRRGYNVSWTGFAEAIDKGDTEALELFFKAGYDSWTPTWVLQHRGDVAFLHNELVFGCRNGVQVVDDGFRLL